MVLPPRYELRGCLMKAAIGAVADEEKNNEKKDKHYRGRPGPERGRAALEVLAGVERCGQDGSPRGTPPAGESLAADHQPGADPAAAAQPAVRVRRYGRALRGSP